MPPRFLIGLGQRPHLELPHSQGGLNNRLTQNPEHLALRQQAVTDAQLFMGERGMDVLARDRNPRDAELLEASYTGYRQHASEGHYDYYARAIQLMAARLALTEEPETRTEIRQLALETAQEALNHMILGDPRRGDQDPTPMSHPVAARALYDIAYSLSYVFHRNDGTQPTEAQVELLQAYYRQMLARFEAAEVEVAHQDGPPLPAYFGDFVRSQMALLDGEMEAGFDALLAAQSGIREADRTNPLPAGNRGAREQMRLYTEMAIQSFARDPQGLLVQNFRTRISAEALSYFYIVDQIGEDPTEEAIHQARQEVGRFQLISHLLLQHMAPGLTLEQVLERLRDPDSDTYQGLEQTFETLYRVNGTAEDREENPFRQALDDLGLSGLSRSEIWRALKNSTAQVAAHLYERRNLSAYATVLQEDSDNRPIREATRLLSENEELFNNVLNAFDIPEEHHESYLPEDVVYFLIRFGDRLPRLLQAQMPDELRSDRTYESFRSAMVQAARGARGIGREQNVEVPLQNLMNRMERLAEHDETYAAAYAAFFQSFSEREYLIVPPNENSTQGVRIPTTLRMRAEERAQAMANPTTLQWLGQRVENVFFTPESLLHIGFGIAAMEIGTLALVRMAGSTGRLGISAFGRRLANFVEDGSLTLGGEMLVGVGVAGAMTTVGGVAHILDTPQPWTEDISEIWPNLAIGFVASSIAIAGMMASGHYLGRVFLPRGMAHGLVRRTTFRILNNWGGGSALMLSAGTVTRGLATGQWELPSQEDTAEMFLTMAAWDGGAAGVRRIGNRLWWRQQLGPHRYAELVERPVREMMERNPQLRPRQQELERWLGHQIARGRSIEGLSERMEQGLIPTFQGEGRQARLNWETHEVYQVRRAQEMLEGSEFQQFETQLREELSNIFQNNAEATDRWVQVVVHRDGKIEAVVLEGEPPNGDQSFRVDRDGNYQDYQNLTEPLLREALTLRQREMDLTHREAVNELLANGNFREGLQSIKEVIRNYFKNHRNGHTRWFQVELNDGVVDFQVLDRAPATPEDQARSVALDRNGNFWNFPALRDPVLREAFARLQRERTHALLETNGLSTPEQKEEGLTFLQDLNHPWRQILETTILEIRSDLAANTSSSDDPPEGWMRVTRQGDDLQVERLTEAPEVNHRAGVVRITTRGITGPQLNETMPHDPVLRLAVTVMGVRAFRQPVLPRPAGMDAGGRSDSDAPTAGHPTAPETATPETGPADPATSSPPPSPGAESSGTPSAPAAQAGGSPPPPPPQTGARPDSSSPPPPAGRPESSQETGGESVDAPASGEVPPVDPPQAPIDISDGRGMDIYTDGTRGVETAADLVAQTMREDGRRTEHVPPEEAPEPPTSEPPVPEGAAGPTRPETPTDDLVESSIPPDGRGANSEPESDLGFPRPPRGHRGDEPTRAVSTILGQEPGGETSPRSPRESSSESGTEEASGGEEPDPVTSSERNSEGDIWSDLNEEMLGETGEPVGPEAPEEARTRPEEAAEEEFEIDMDLEGEEIAEFPEDDVMDVDLAADDVILEPSENAEPAPPPPLPESRPQPYIFPDGFIETVQGALNSPSVQEGVHWFRILRDAHDQIGLEHFPGEEAGRFPMLMRDSFRVEDGRITGDRIAEGSEFYEPYHHFTQSHNQGQTPTIPPPPSVPAEAQTVPSETPDFVPAWRSELRQQVLHALGREIPGRPRQMDEIRRELLQFIDTLEPLAPGSPPETRLIQLHPREDGPWFRQVSEDSPRENASLYFRLIQMDAGPPQLLLEGEPRNSFALTGPGNSPFVSIFRSTIGVLLRVFGNIDPTTG